MHKARNPLHHDFTSAEAHRRTHIHTYLHSIRLDIRDRTEPTGKFSIFARADNAFTVHILDPNAIIVLGNEGK